MPKVFYTERDIEDMVKQGVQSLQVNDNVVLTDLAYEKANRLGLKLIYDKPGAPPAAPVRPYILQPAAIHPPAAPTLAAAQTTEADLHQRIRSAVLARMGGQVDPGLLDVIIQRVLERTGLK